MSQEYQHKKEELFLNFLRNNYQQRWKSFSDLHNDYSTGIDVKLDDEYYDLKVSNPNKKITIFKKHKRKGKWEWYSPLTEHMDVKYMYVIEYEKCYMMYVLKKEKIIEYMLSQPQITEYTGDDNINICITLNNIELVAEDWFDLRK